MTGMFGSRKSGKQTPVALDQGPMASSALALSRRVLAIGIDGAAGFDSAQQVADAALRDHRHPDRAVQGIVSQHRKLAAKAGFVTGLGGFVTMVVAMPTNILGFYILTTRMVAAIAMVRGYDVRDERVRTAILLTLVGTDADDLLKRAGVVSSGRLAGLATRQLPAPALMVVNKAVGFRLVSQLGDKVFTKLGKGIPFAGGVLGAGLDVLLLNRIAASALHEFPAAGTRIGAAR
ncbi:EcsC family protein [Rudaeicoccus suwonensis]|uniref:EcsC family protein n=2 Tax=Rudaeicoccus suwonensis TaxID=657409 RepID=A0A561ECD7_9MICO|nr:EcsC family protein [Rudaeicoccus suwonensis]